MSQHDLFSAFGGGLIDCQNLIHDPEQDVKRRLNGIAAIDSDVPANNFLQDFGIRHQSLPLADQPFKQSLSIALVRMRRADEIHGDIRVHQNHGWPPAPYPLSI